MAFDDDFVHTISDNDDVSDLDEDVAPPTASAASKKRKRNGDDSVDVSKSSKKQKSKDDVSSRKSKQSKKGKAASAAEDEDESPTKARDSGVDVNDEDAELDSDFEFVVGDLKSGVLEDFDGWEEKSKQEKAKGGLSLDEIIEKRRAAKGDSNGVNGAEKDSDEDEEPDVELDEEDDELLADDAFGMGATGEDESGAEDEDDENDGEDGEEEESDDDSVAEPVPHPDDLEGQDESEEEAEDDEEAQRRRDFFAPESNLHGEKEPNAKTAGSFQAMSLSRPILKGLSAVGFNEPTPIQAKTIPVALLGKDVVGSAVTGSGKTAAFMIPILERLLYRPKKVPTTRVAVLMPTRELAVQCFNVSKKLASFTDITFAQIVGGFSLREQENVLKQRPDVVIATPGRFIDHVKNSPSFAVDTLEILVLDEADRMLEDGFADELDEILNSIPKSRQTMLFSATMTESVDSLVRTGLNRPVRLMVDAKKQTVAGLVQEFIRLRPGKEDKRLAYLMYLCEKVYTERVIVFFGQKKEAHRVRVIFALCGLKASELHGSMSQEQRIAAIESFRSGTTNYLLATDLASRGLDIKNINTVLNYSVPRTHEIYLHRVGRTARAGRTGRACTLAAEPDRKVVRAAVKSAKAQGAVVQSRSIPEEDIARWTSKLKTLEDELEAVLEEEKEEKALNIADRELTKSDNLIMHEAEIHSRPKREWFQTEREKKAAALKGKPEGEGGKKKKLSGKEKKKLEDRDMRGEGKVWKKGKGDVKTMDDKSIGKDKKREMMKGNKRLSVPGVKKRDEKPKIQSRGNKAGGKRK